jgi:hypothetical protein
MAQTPAINGRKGADFLLKGLQVIIGMLVPVTVVFVTLAWRSNSDRFAYISSSMSEIKRSVTVATSTLDARIGLLQAEVTVLRIFEAETRANRFTDKNANELEAKLEAKRVKAYERILIAIDVIEKSLTDLREKFAALPPEIPPPAVLHRLTRLETQFDSLSASLSALAEEVHVLRETNSK